MCFESRFLVVRFVSLEKSVPDATEHAVVLAAVKDAARR